ncbi:hypothetical protein GGI13_001423 [Coemansia sp. RSA 455]|nr:hypothetical protein GGI13_001423 [Coemansia sp. RSA 455]
MASRRAAPKNVSNRRKTEEDGNDSDDEMMVVEAHYSDDDGKVQYSAAVHKLLEQYAGNRPLYDSSDDYNSDNDNSSDSVVPPKEPSITKIIYASQTHSHLQQFVNEIKRTQFASNDKVECKMLELRIKMSARCDYLPLQHTPMLDFKSATGSAIMDIEEITKKGRRHWSSPSDWRTTRE